MKNKQEYLRKLVVENFTELEEHLFALIDVLNNECEIEDSFDELFITKAKEEFEILNSLLSGSVPDETLLDDYIKYIEYLITD